MEKKLILVFAILVLFTATAFSGINDKKPKNVILLIGDGMGINYVTTSVLKLDNDPYKRFKTVGLVVTVSADALVTDSAAGATAFATGHKTNNGIISMTPDGKSLQSIAEFLKGEGYSTGVVSTSGITHATPACFYAHVMSRNQYFDIAEQLVESDVDLAIGGKWSEFLPKEDGGVREDELNLKEKAEEKGIKFMTSVDELMAHNGEGRYFALVEEESLPHAAERDYTLGQLTEKALKTLSKDEDGFFLMVEGSQIDWSGHANEWDPYGLGEMKDFNTAINAALDFAEKDGNTLVIVTADHETGGLAINGEDENGNLEIGYASKSHTGVMVGVFTFGPGSEHFNGIIDNTKIGKQLFELLK